MVKKCKDKQSLRRVEAHSAIGSFNIDSGMFWGVDMCITNSTSVEIEIKLLIISTGEFLQYNMCYDFFEIKYKTQSFA